MDKAFIIVTHYVILEDFHMSEYTTTILYLLVICVIFYFLLIRPEKKKKKKLQDMRETLTVGNGITTIGGMIGTVVEIDDDKVTFETGEDRVRIQVMRWAISSVNNVDVI